MRVNVYTTDFTGEFELVTNSDRAEETGGELLDGVRIITSSAGDPDLPEEGVTFWVPVDRYEEYAAMFEGMAAAVRGLAAQRSRS